MDVLGPRDDFGHRAPHQGGLLDLPDLLDLLERGLLVNVVLGLARQLDLRVDLSLSTTVYSFTLPTRPAVREPNRT
jgi:hypothetical protein